VSGIAGVIGFVAVTVSCSTGQPSAPPPVDRQTVAPPSSGGGVVVGHVPRTPEGLPAIVILEPDAPRDFPAPTEPVIMDQSGLAFVPDVVLAQVGQTVRFRSSEDVLHNVRVVEAGTNTPVFNVATVPFGSYEHVFDKPSVYDVSCDIHPAMHANVFVTSTPYAVTTDSEGNFSFADVPPGPYTLTIYAGARHIQEKVDVTAPRTELKIPGN
jgi:plastocyanin